LTWYYSGLFPSDLSIVGDRIVAIGGKPHGRNIYVSLDEGSTWSEKRIGVTFQEYFTSVSVTADGQSIIVCNEYDGVYTSVDGGTTFVSAVGLYDYEDGDYIGTNRDGWVVKVSQDGSTFVVCPRYMGMSYYSTDGTTWLLCDFTGGGISDYLNGIGSGNGILALDLSDDGDVIVLAGDFYNALDTRMFISVNGGVSWSAITDPMVSVSDTYWRIAITGDGLVLYCIEYSTKKLWRSVDSGSSWSLITTLSSWYPRGLTLSDDGDAILVNDSGSLWLSTDYGDTFSSISSDYLVMIGNDFNESQSMNDTGNMILFSNQDEDNQPWLSLDAGSSWAALESTIDTEYCISSITGTDTDFSIIFGFEELYITTVASTPESFSDEGYYPSVYIHGLRIEDGESALKNQTQVDMDWKLPFAYPYIIGAPDDIVEYRRIRLQHTTPFWTKEKSLEDSRPIELHRFSTATEIWRYADAPYNVDYNGTDGIVIFRGFVQNVNFKQDSRNGVRRAEVTIEPYSGNTRFQALAMTYERLCPVAIYGSLCGVDQDESGAVWNDSGVLTGVTNTILTAAEFGDQVDGWYDGGKIVIDNRRRKILSHTGTSIIISRIIPGTAIGDAFDVYAGCDRLPATCNSKFDNLLNCKAHPNIPHEDSNPFGTNGVVT